MQQPLNLTERQEAIHLISHHYCDSDVIKAVRSLLELKEQDRRVLWEYLNKQYPAAELPDPVPDDTKPLEIDGD